MKQIVKTFFLLLICSLFILNVNAKEKEITLYFFHGDGCPHCAEEEKFLKKVDDKVKIVNYEVWYDEKNQDFMDKVSKIYGIKSSGVPLTIIGDTFFIGYSDTIGRSINRAINYYLENDNKYKDEVKKIKEDNNAKIKIVDEFSKEEEKNKDKYILDVPIFGKINLKNLSIFSSSVLIGLIDGFNPCAMWVLIFLITILIGMRDKKRMLILGITFLTTSAFIYMLIMFSWLNVIVKVSTSILIRNIIGLFAIIGGIYNLYSFIKSNDSGCNVVDEKKRKKVIKAIKKFTHEKSFFLAILGVMALAVSVNLVELACSAGLPLVFTQLLAVNNVSSIQGFLYTLLYILFFLMDDLIIFIIAVCTMNVTGISTKYNKYSHLIGGIIMLVIGILLIFNYKLLTFGF